MGSLNMRVKRLKHNLTRFTGYFLLLAFILLALARFIDFPISFFMVSGRSMEPTLLVGDIVIGVKGNYTAGDIVVVEGVNRVNCIVHRAVNITGRTVVTKGDANPGPDNPIGREYVLYKVVLIAPRLAWIPPFLAILFILGFRYFRGLLQGAEIGRTLLTVVLFFSIFHILTMVMIPIFHVHQTIDVKRPSIVLRSTSVSEDYRFFKAVYGSITMLEFARVEWVKINATGREFIPAQYFFENNTLVVSVPPEVYEALYANSSSTASGFRVYCKILFDKASLYGSYPLTFSWRRIDVKAVNDSVTVFNPNPVAFNISFEIQYYDLDKFGRLNYVCSERFENVLQPVSTFTVRPEKKGVECYVIIRYVFLGRSVMDSKKVNLVED
ncbi:MAG: signal peptidase I [Candidatus Brockarchaeota archaeon]|nr:signal peptidase I [Candidatus Brockarchaeota archaeon]